ncbi:hypothetical protein [Paenibacillus sp. MMO-177]
MNINTVISYAEEKGWKQVNYTLVYENGGQKNIELFDVAPEDILLQDVASSSATLSDESVEGRAMFMSYAEARSAFLDLKQHSSTESPEKVLIIMEKSELI